MAFEICERTCDGPPVLLCGLRERGYLLASILHGYLKELAPAVPPPFVLEKQVVPPADSLKAHLPGAVAILVDDVLYTGETLYQAVSTLYAWQPATIQIATLVDRGHRRLPVRPDYVGLELATTLQEYIVVHFDEDGRNVEAWLR